MIYVVFALYALGCVLMALYVTDDGLQDMNAREKFVIVFWPVFMLMAAVAALLDWAAEMWGEE